MPNFNLVLSNQNDAMLLNKNIPEGISLNIPQYYGKKIPGAEEIAINIIVSFGVGVPASLVASWLYDKLKNGSSRQISINRREINFDKGEITRIIEESINIKE